MVNTEVPARLSFYYTGVTKVEKKVAKKCCSKRIETEVMKYLDSFNQLQTNQMASQNKELAAYNGLGTNTWLPSLGEISRENISILFLLFILKIK